jgi:hypothetical protein
LWDQLLAKARRVEVVDGEIRRTAPMRSQIALHISNWRIDAHGRSTVGVEWGSSVACHLSWGG